MFGTSGETSLPVAVTAQYFTCVTHVGTNATINAVPSWISYTEGTKMGYSASDGDSSSAFLQISIGA
jgi:hypothetical protein